MFLQRSKFTLKELAGLLKAAPGLKLIHTTYPFHVVADMRISELYVAITTLAEELTLVNSRQAMGVPPYGLSLVFEGVQDLELVLQVVDALPAFTHITLDDIDISAQLLGLLSTVFPNLESLAMLLFVVIPYGMACRV